MLVLTAMTAAAQNVAIVNPPANEDNNQQVAYNNNLGNQNNINLQETNIFNEQNNPPQVQAQIQEQVQQASNPSRGNFINTNNDNPVNNVRQQKYGQSIQIPSGSGSYSGSSGKASVKTHTHKSFAFVMKKTFKSKYSHPRNYSHKKKVKKCHSF